MRDLVYQIKQYINQVDSSKSLMDSIKKYISGVEDRILKDEENLKHLKSHLHALSENHTRSEKFLKSLSVVEPERVSTREPTENEDPTDEFKYREKYWNYIKEHTTND